MHFSNNTYYKGINCVCAIVQQIASAILIIDKGVSRMTGFWLISYLVLWIIVIGFAMVILALAREIEVLHQQLESFRRVKTIDK